MESLLRRDWSPEQIAGRLSATGTLRISHETIYRYVWENKKRGGDLYQHLRCAQKKRRKRYRSYDSRGRLAGKVHISERPASAETRKKIGHWEIDTVIGEINQRDCIVTIVERKTGFVQIGKLPRRRGEDVTRRTVQLIRRHEQSYRTITADNGTEFHDYKECFHGE